MEMSLVEKIDSILVKKHGTKKLAAALESPIRLKMDHYSLGRRLLLVDPIPPKTKIAKYEIDGREVSVPKFTIASDITVNRKRWHKLVDLVSKDLEKKELRKILNLLAYVVKESQQVIKGAFSKKNFMSALRLVEQNDLKVASIVMNPKMYKRVLKMFSDMVDPCYHKEMLNVGLIGWLWGMNILVNRNVSNKIYFCAEPEFAGALPLYRDPTCVACVERDGTLRIITEEEVGMGILNIKGVSVLDVREKRVKG